MPARALSTTQRAIYRKNAKEVKCGVRNGSHSFGHLRLILESHA